MHHSLDVSSLGSLKKTMNVRSAMNLATTQGGPDLPGSGPYSGNVATSALRSPARSLHFSDPNLGLYTTHEEDDFEDLTAVRATESPDLGLGSSDNGQMSSLERVIGHPSNYPISVKSPGDKHYQQQNNSFTSPSQRSNTTTTSHLDSTLTTVIGNHHNSTLSNSSAHNQSFNSARDIVSGHQACRSTFSCSPQKLRQPIGVVISSRPSLSAGVGSSPSQPCSIPSKHKYILLDCKLNGNT